MPETPAPSESSAVDANSNEPLLIEQIYRLRFTRGVFDAGSPVLADVLAPVTAFGGRVIAFLDEGLAQATPGLDEDIRRYFGSGAGRAMNLVGIHTVSGGEAAKNGREVVDRVLEQTDRAGICRQSFVIAAGGGAMLDAVGFAAATAHRGVRLVRLPSTSLAQADAGIGVKNGINLFGKKNFLGTFTVPWAVINDADFLRTLSMRDWRCGLSEAVKVALVKDAAFFEEIEAAADALARRDEEAIVPIIARSAELHLRHIVDGGDPFELTAARPLDFGHWSAHRMEQITGFRLRHGEAVAIGIALDVLYCALDGRLRTADADRVIRCLEALGFSLDDEALDEGEALLDGLEEFREHLGGRLTIALLEGIGASVDVHEIDRPRMLEAIRVLRHNTRQEGKGPNVEKCK